MRCPECNTGNPEGAKFCLECSSRLALACPECATPLPPGARFCLQCGARLTTAEAPAPEPTPAVAPATIPDRIRRLMPQEYVDRLLAAGGQMAGERRLVTILFSDVKGSTAMAERLDPEEVMEIMDGGFDVLIEPIMRYQGTLARLMGDGILAFFGAPIAHEDDPERACRAALEIVAGAQEYAARLEEERSIEGFNVRVGINTGLVVVGEVGSDLRVEYTAMGDAINLAARMESAADPGTVLVSEATHRLIAPLFETEARGPIQVKGKQEAVPAYRVLSAKEVPGKARGIEGLQSELVGREPEFIALREALERLQSGMGSIVTIVGEAGIGKSRLVAELRRHVGAHRRAPLRWLEGRCLSYGTSIAYLLWLDVLRSVLNMSADESPAAVADALQEFVRSVCPDRFDSVYPYLARVMSLPQDEKTDARLRDLAGERLKANTFRAVETLTECAAGQGPLVLVCEDLHWADATSLDLLQQLFSLSDRCSLLIICVFRPRRERGCWALREVAARDYPHRHTDLTLQALSSAHSEALIHNLLQSESVPAAFRARVLRTAEGNPFFVEEILRGLIDQGVVVADEQTGGWRVTEGAADVRLPETLQGVLMARIDRLLEDTRRVLQIASVIGRIFHYRVLAAIAEEDRKLDAHLVTLQREEMIRERARLPELEYIFKHHLTREAAYNGLLKKERRVIHRRVAEALEQLFPERVEEQVELLAYHWEQAEELGKAVDYLLRTGDRARRLGASQEAIEFYKTALRREAELDAEGAAIEAHRIHERLGDVFFVNLSRHDEALEHYKSFLGIAEAAEDLARGERKVAGVYMLQGDLAKAQQHYEAALARLSSLPPLAEASRVHCGLAYLLMSENRLNDAQEHARASFEISGRISDVRGQADANRVMGVIASQRGNSDTARKYDERSLALYRELGDLPRIAQACNNVGDSYRVLGQMEQALDYLSEGLELAQRIGDTREEALLLLTMAELSLDRGQWETAITHLQRALPLAQQAGVAARLIEAHRILGSAYQGAERLEDARRHLEMAETVSRDTQHLRFLPGVYLNLAHLSVAQGRCDEAGRYIKQALDAAGPKPSDAFLGIMHRCQGTLHGQRGNWNDAVVHLQDSLTLLERVRIPAEVSKTCVSLGTAYASRNDEGDRGRACEQLLAALAIFQRIGAQGYLTEVEARLRKVGCQ